MNGLPVKRIPRSVWAILLVALALRVAVTVTRTPADISDDGGFYLEAARRTALQGQPLLGWRESLQYTSVAPLYPALLVLLYTAVPEQTVLIVLKLLQSLLDALTVLLVYRAGTRLFGQRAAFVAAIAMALDVRFILQAADPTTETLYIVLSVAGFSLYLRAVKSERLRDFALSGAVFGLASLTRPVPLVLPLALGVHALLAGERRRRQLAGVAVLTLSLWATITPWTIRNAVVTGGQFIPVSSAAASGFWLGSAGDGRYHGQDGYYETLQEDIGQQSQEVETGRTLSPVYVQAGLGNIIEAPFAYLGKRVRNTLEAYLQPYGTFWFPGESIKDILVRWLRGEATFSEVVRAEAFWLKLVVYLFHFTALIFGLAGLALAWRRWREVLPLALMIAYGTAVYAFLLVIPRYLFPIMPFYWIAAGSALVWLWDRVKLREVVSGKGLAVSGDNRDSTAVLGGH